MEDFGKVGLGFAEFVSQLLHETFDATLSAQNYQLEKYLDLEKALNLSPARFRELFISDEEANEKETDMFGTTLVANMTVSQTLLEIIAALVEDYSSIIFNKKLTNTGYSILRQMVNEALVRGKKDNLRLLLNKSEMAQLMVESGEIKAKLELSVLSKTQDATPASNPAGVRAANIAAEDETRQQTSDQLKYGNFSSKVLDVKGVKVTELKDDETNQRILIINKSDDLNEVAKFSALPDTRIIATPVQSTTSGNLFSEITIRFKTK